MTPIEEVTYAATRAIIEQHNEAGIGTPRGKVVEPIGVGDLTYISGNFVSETEWRLIFAKKGGPYEARLYVVEPLSGDELFGMAVQVNTFIQTHTTLHQ